MISTKIAAEPTRVESGARQALLRHLSVSCVYQNNASRQMNAVQPIDPIEEAEQRQAALADWFLRRTGADWTPADERALERWLDADAANRRAWQQWTADWSLIDQLDDHAVARLRGLAYADGDTRRREQAIAGKPAQQRRAWLSGLVVAGVGAFTVSAGWLVWRHDQTRPLYQQVVSTDPGQLAELTLPDGSQLRLDTATRLKVSYYRQHREVELSRGQALFAVTADPTRPFTVTAASVRVTVLGTRFAVRRTPDVPGRDGVEVAVEEGRVRVAQQHALGEEPGQSTAAARSFDLTAGQQLVFSAPDGSAVLGALPAEGAAPWRHRQLSFSNVPLRQALAELARYGALNVVEVHPAVAPLRLTATLDPRDAEATRRLLSAALPVVIEQTPTGLQALPAR